MKWECRTQQSLHRATDANVVEETPVSGQSLAGCNFGAVLTPCIGQEVLVSFLGGDIDRPVIVGAGYNGQGTPDV